MIHLCFFWVIWRFKCVSFVSTRIGYALTLDGSQPKKCSKTFKLMVEKHIIEVEDIQQEEA